ncbi:Hypothetical predicted protein [Pelobates cultripes]|uniref:Uncharacterized protein n=1 Tax=Pelobates cultripes TaxID=61616 RepID=A0AAD1TEN0_PELCU|nr:Hypothetical predicted protein [Pelobates cultripes]
MGIQAWESCARGLLLGVCCYGRVVYSEAEQEDLFIVLKEVLPPALLPLKDDVVSHVERYIPANDSVLKEHYKHDNHYREHLCSWCQECCGSSPTGLLQKS